MLSSQNGGLETWDDYTRVLYDGQLKNSNPRGTSPGIQSNATQDLLFSMSLLSLHPYVLEKVKQDAQLLLSLDDEITEKIAGDKETLTSLRDSDRLFIADFSYQKDYDVAEVVEHYHVACTGYFFIHKDSGDFLPLAIRTNTDADLTYTPLDDYNDWLLAKMFFNANDMFDAQMRHLVHSHDVTESVHQAAIHTLHESHPIMTLLERAMVQGYSSRIVGEELCFNPGGHWDQLMVYNQFACRDFVSDRWKSDGRFKGGYLENNLRERGLIDKEGKYPFKSFPFYDDARKIKEIFHTFFTKVVDSYYKTNQDVQADCEVKAWFVEASEKAKAQDFPTKDEISKEVLVDVMSHFYFATSVMHHSVNGATPIRSATLPFHIPALYAPTPKEKGVKDLKPWLPDVKTSLHYLGFMASFSRLFYANDGRTLDQAFGKKQTTSYQLNKASQDAAKRFWSQMQELGDEINDRTFDDKGLSQHMPFIYNLISPDAIPFFCAV